MGGEKKRKNLASSAAQRKLEVVRCCDMLTPEVAMTRTCSNFCTDFPPGVLTGAIHHGGMGPPRTQGWAINRPELSAFSSVWTFILTAVCWQAFNWILRTRFRFNLVQKYTIITLKHKQPLSHVCGGSGVLTERQLEREQTEYETEYAGL